MPVAAHSTPHVRLQVDMYAWSNPDFLPVFAAGNDGQAGVTTSGAVVNGSTTVTSPGKPRLADGCPFPAMLAPCALPFPSYAG